MFKRFFSTLLVLAMALSFATVPAAQADTFTGPWTWTDISGQLTERNNRPVWASAYANGNWFYTDGQDLWNGGQAYRYDGYTQINITTDVRNAGVNRVDDIVSDGQTILFLQDVVRLDNQLKAVTYRNGQYVNVTNTLRNALNSNEGVSSVNGRNGTWYIVTTQKRLLRWDGSLSNPIALSLPTSVSGNEESMLYSVNHGSVSNVCSSYRPCGYVLNIAMVPVASGNWLLHIRNASNAANALFYRYDGSSFTDITNQFSQLSSVEYLDKMTSNGQRALLIGREDYSGRDVTWMGFTDGLSVTKLTPNDFSHTGNILSAWNGKSWMLLWNKVLYRLEDGYGASTQPKRLGEVADRFLQAAGDNGGRILLGGALSTIGSSSPSYPLTAKLVMVTEGIAPPVTGTNGNTTSNGTSGTERIYTSSNGPRVAVQGDPTDFRIGNGKEFTYRVSATDTDGMSQTEIYVNGTRIKTCAGGSCEFRAPYFTTGNQSTRSVQFFTRAMDYRGNVTDTSNYPDTLVVDANSSGGTNTTPSGTLSAWSWFDPAVDLKRNATAQFRADGWAERGINSMELWVNGSIKRTCWFQQAYGTQSCSTTIYGSDYTAGSVLSANAKMTDANNQVTWSTLRSITVVNADNGTVTPPTNNADAAPSVWEWTEPSTDRITTNGSAMYAVGAWDADGVRSITIMVNGVARPACTFSPGYGNQECRFTLSGSSYSPGSAVFMNAVARDAYGRETWTAGKIVRVTGSGTNGTSVSSQGTINVYSNSSWTFRANEMITVTSQGSDADGVNRVELTVNAVRVKTCTGTANCSVTIGPFPTRSVVTFGATLFDNLGNSVSTGYKQLLKTR
jgi:hypothetical protein